jgi:hypothetical protein
MSDDRRSIRFRPAAEPFVISTDDGARRSGRIFFSMETQMNVIRLLFATTLAPLLLYAQARAEILGVLAGCKQKEDMQRVLDLADQTDFAAAQELLARGIRSKDCRVLAGDEIVVESAPLFARLVKVHVRGNPDIYWIVP